VAAQVAHKRATSRFEGPSITRIETFFTGIVKFLGPRGHDAMAVVMLNGIVGLSQGADMLCGLTFRSSFTPECRPRFVIRPVPAGGRAAVGLLDAVKLVELVRLERVVDDR
jgi:hypothetical protein